VDFTHVADNLRASFRAIAASRASGEIRELHGVSIAAAGAAFQMFNAAFLSSPVLSADELERRIMLAAMHFESRGQQWAYWVCEDWLPPRSRRKSLQAFERHGLRHSVDLPGMVAESLAAPVRPLARIEVRRVRPGVTRDAFCAIGSTCFHVPTAWFLEVFESESVWDAFAAWVGYVDGEPVSTTATVFAGGAIGVYNVGTLPEYQGRGYAEAVMRQAVAEAQRRHGVERTLLQSTAAGFPMYERMGYRTVTSVAVFAT
jgi:ribosomal protein S18 acetylase RimI-like enzyme